MSDMPEVIYDPERFRETHLVRFSRFVQEKYGLMFADSIELRSWSVLHTEKFWECVWQFFDIKYSVPYSEVCVRHGSGVNDARWFVGAQLNYTENVLRHRDDHLAMIIVDDVDNEEKVSYAQLHDEVAAWAAALKAAGIGKGDIVACSMDNNKEAVFLFLATASMGAVFSGTMPKAKTSAILSRYQQIKPKILFVSADAESKKHVQDIIAGLPSLEKVIVIPSHSQAKISNILEIPLCLPLSSFVNESHRTAKEIEYEQVPFDHPLCISFTSGTTGTPKGFKHSYGFLLISLKDYALSQDISRKDVFSSHTMSGWHVWHLNVTSLLLGRTQLHLPATFFMQRPEAFWALVEKHAVSCAFLHSVYIETMQQKHLVPSQPAKRLRQLLPVGSVLKDPAIDFLRKRVRQGLFCSPIYGLTECSGSLNGLDHNLPVHRGEMQSLSLGMDLRVLDETGAEVPAGEKGELALCGCYPALPLALVGDPLGHDIKRRYLDKFNGYWESGDIVSINPKTKGLIIHGRSDDFISLDGRKIWSFEVYDSVCGHEGVRDAMCVQPRGLVVLLVRCEAPLTASQREHIAQLVFRKTRVELHAVLETPEFPRNDSGKKLPGVVKKLLEKDPDASIENVINTSCVDFFRGVQLF